jgi:peptide/nickel transport system substrate-binding protein
MALAGVIAIAAVACGGNGSSSSTTPGSANSGSGTAHTGGSIIIGAEQWPQCLNPVTDCASASWYLYTIQEFVFPRLMQWSNDVQPTPSALITEVPSVDNQGITQSPFSVTYHLNPKAVWSDGTAITCDDVNFTWLAILNTTGTYSTAGYTTEGGAAGINKVTCPDPQTVVLGFNKVYVDWPDLFGGAAGFILEKAAFPNLASATKPDLKSEMNDSITFSGGPWVLQSWDATNQAVLVRNDKYWGQKTYLDQVTFVPREDQATEVSSILSGDVDAIFPQPSNVPFADQFGQNPNVKAIGGDGNFVEALWFNLSDPLMKDPKVRQALAYGVDRQAVISGVIALNNPKAEVNNCGLWIPGQGPWCADPGSFTQYAYDAEKAASILKSDGYTDDRDGTGYFTKNGKPLTITIATTAGNVRRATTVSLLQQTALAAGINIQIHTYVPTDLFSNVAPKGDFQVALYAQGPIIDPTVTGSFSCAQIPTSANGYGGGNWDHWCNKDADALMLSSDQELDQTKRASEIQQIAALSATDLPMLPVDVLPNIAAWRTDKVAGVDPTSLSSPYGFFFGMSTWYAAS